MITLTEGSVVGGLAVSFRQGHKITALLARNKVKTVSCASIGCFASNTKCLYNINIFGFSFFDLTLELYAVGGGIFVLKSQPALPSFFPSVEAMMGA